MEKEDLMIKNKITYQNKLYSKKEWYSVVCDFYKNKQGEYSLLRISKNLKKEYVLDIFLKNISKYTFLGLILPSVIFSLCFLIIMLVFIFWQIKGNFKGIINSNSLIFLVFIGIFFLVLSIILFYKWKIRKDKCFISKVSDGYKYTIIKNEEYIKILNMLKEE